MHRDVGYMQGMCDLVAPLLVILEDGTSTSIGTSTPLLVQYRTEQSIPSLFFSPLLSVVGSALSDA